MKRADRLYALTQKMKDGQLHTAEALAQDLGVSVRTIYRDMERLAQAGVPVAGARGAGYMAEAAVTLPPLNLSETEVEVLHLALAVVGGSSDPDTAEAAASLSAKLDAVLPEDGAQPGFGFVPHPFAEAAQGFRHMPVFRKAIRARQKLRITQQGITGTVRPLALDYWGRVWTCIVWDETADGFASFRLDQISEVAVLPGLFVEEPGKTLQDYRAARAPSA